jgi:hypothetical protein
LEGVGIAGKFVGLAGVGWETDCEEFRAEQLGSAGDVFGGGGARDNGEQCIGAVGLQDGGAEQIEPPGFEVGALREA